MSWTFKEPEGKVDSFKQGFTKRCRLSWLTISVLAKCARGGGGVAGISAIRYSCAHGAQISFGDLTPYLTYGFKLQTQN